MNSLMRSLHEALSFLVAFMLDSRRGATLWRLTVEIPSLDVFGPYLQQLSFGAIAGFAAGYALKKVGKVLAVVLGLFFIFLQILAYYGFVRIDWVEVQNSVDPLLGSDSLGNMWQRLINILTYNISFAVAFVPAFIIGLKRG